MKTIYLVRHAKSSWNYPELDDFERPLNKRGRRSALLMGAILNKRKAAPDLVISSPANRAAMTARCSASDSSSRPCRRRRNIVEPLRRGKSRRASRRRRRSSETPRVPREAERKLPISNTDLDFRLILQRSDFASWHPTDQVPGTICLPGHYSASCHQAASPNHCTCGDGNMRADPTASATADR